MNTTFYGSVVEATAYFSARLHEQAWTNAAVEDRAKALLAATQLIDTLNYKGNKAAVYALLETNSAATSEDVRAAELSQALEFPRGADTEVPEAIRQACYEIAYSLLDGKNPELELEALGVSSQSYSSVKTAYDRQQVPIEHTVNMIPSALAWRLIRPFLRGSETVRLSRVS
jgi:hypothetical protein